MENLNFVVRIFDEVGMCKGCVNVCFHGRQSQLDERANFAYRSRARLLIKCTIYQST